MHVYINRKLVMHVYKIVYGGDPNPNRNYKARKLVKQSYVVFAWGDLNENEKAK